MNIWNMRFKLRKCILILVFIIGALVILQIAKQNQLFTDQKSYHKGEGNFGIRSDFDNGVFVDKNLGRLKDWHDKKLIAADRAKRGSGEQGVVVPLFDNEKGSSAYSENGFNIMVSNRISLNRSLPDIRHKNCRTKLYAENLPSTSIIIPFHNEGWSTLLRTLHSIINRSPPQLLKEIILVDDASLQEHLKERLDTELKKYPKVKLIRLRNRQGLIRARLNGVNEAQGEVIVILDSHVEVTHNWLPPLLDPIAKDRTVITCPMIDIVDKDDFHYLTQPGDAMRGAFDWELYYKRIPIPADKQLPDPSDPFEDPVMAGGLFAANREYFNEIGQYDSGLEIWGGEQYELSFKTWMCGGKILDSPCSRVGHIYRKFMPYSLPKGTNINKNFKRVAEVWMDEYAEYFYKKRPHVRSIDPGDLTAQKDLRKRLKCKSFDWFMREVAPDILRHYPPVLPEPAAWGQIRNEGTGFCLTVSNWYQNQPLTVSRCKVDGYAEQEFILTWKEDIRPGKSMKDSRKVCLDAQGLNQPVVLWDCHGQFGNQLWKYIIRKKQLFHSVTGHCASADKVSGKVLLLPCQESDRNQAWTWQNSDTKKLAVFNAKPNAHS